MNLDALSVPAPDGNLLAHTGDNGGTTLHGRQAYQGANRGCRSRSGDVRGIVIGMNGTFVKVLAIGTSKETGDTVVLRYVHDYPASQCMYLEKQTLNL